MFIESRYTKIYWSIINRAKNRASPELFERHHIIPRSLGGSNEASNLVDLTPKEHYFVHHLLTRMIENGQHSWKMMHAFLMMSSKQNNRINSITYHKLKSRCPTWNQGIPRTAESRAKQSAAMKGKEPWNKGKLSPQSAINGKRSAAKVSVRNTGRKRVYKDDGSYTYIYPE